MNFTAAATSAIIVKNQKPNNEISPKKTKKRVAVPKRKQK